MAIVASGNDAYLDTPKPFPDEGGLPFTAATFSSNKEGFAFSVGNTSTALGVAGEEAC
jgi:hypothetical protein